MTIEEMRERVLKAKREESATHAAVMAAWGAHSAAQLETYRAQITLLDATGEDEFGPVSASYAAMLREHAAAAEKRAQPHGDRRCGDAACGCAEVQP